jgi:hypothetical protein
MLLASQQSAQLHHTHHHCHQRAEIQVCKSGKWAVYNKLRNIWEPKPRVDSIKYTDFLNAFALLNVALVVVFVFRGYVCT